jgi:DNA-directed RNA polymerase specialized sigma24 family protein
MQATTPSQLTMSDVRSLERMCYAAGVRDEDVVHDAVAKLFSHYDPARGAMSTFVVHVARNKTSNQRRDHNRLVPINEHAKHALYSGYDHFDGGVPLVQEMSEYVGDSLRTSWIAAVREHLKSQQQSSSKGQRALARRANIIFSRMTAMAKTDSLEMIGNMQREKFDFFRALLAKRGEGDVSNATVEAAIVHLRNVVRGAIAEHGL